jgi:hypothetical protein
MATLLNIKRTYEKHRSENPLSTLSERAIRQAVKYRTLPSIAAGVNRCLRLFSSILKEKYQELINYNQHNKLTKIQEIINSQEYQKLSKPYLDAKMYVVNSMIEFSNAINTYIFKQKKGKIFHKKISVLTQENQNVDG